MTTSFVSRHPGAVEWARAQGLQVDAWLPHFGADALAQLAPGDTVVGNLPMHLAAQVCARGARYLHLTLDVPVELRGCELDAAGLAACHARIEPYRVLRD